VPQVKPPKAPKERQIYRETYYKGQVTFKAGCEPKFNHNAPNTKTVGCYLLAAGQVVRGDETLEYQDIRVYFTV
jgi:hypothetical protein